MPSGGTIYVKSDLACFRRGWAYLSVDNKSSSTFYILILTFFGFTLNVLFIHVLFNSLIYSLLLDVPLHMLIIAHLIHHSIIVLFLQVATGDGMAMAHRAQAVISNMEYVLVVNYRQKIDSFLHHDAILCIF